MSQTKARRSSWVGWIVSILLIVGSVWLWTERQFVVDAIHYQQFKPSEAIKEVANQSGLTDDARFTFYATRPAIESSQAFNLHCERKEAKSPILGCYAQNRIYIYDVTDQRIKGRKVVTAAHELLHAEYERLPDSERKRINQLLNDEYKKNTNAELESRMKYYEKTQPGQSLNELHSIVGTEFISINPELEKYYMKFFKNRQHLAQMNSEFVTMFDQLEDEANQLINQIEKLAYSIKTDSEQYNKDTSTLNMSVQSFNKRVENGDYSTQAEFQSARNQLLEEIQTLNDFKQRIQTKIAEYKILLAKLDSINAESASLNQSLDSVLSDVPTI